MANWRERGGGSGRERAQRRQRERAESEAASGAGQANRADWRRKGAAPRRKPGERQRSWTERHDDPTAPKRLRYRIGVFGLGTLLLVALVVFLIWVSRRDRSTQMVVATSPQGSGEEFFSSHFFNEEFRQALRETSQEWNGNLKYIEDDAPVLLSLTSDLETFIKENKLVAGGPNRNILIFCLSVAGVVDDQGEPFFLSFNRYPFNAANWVSVRQFFERLKEFDDHIDSRGPLQKIVIIDSRRLEPLVSPHLMVDEFPNALARLFEDNQLDLEGAGIRVLLSHQAGQRSWTSPELGNSVFGHFVAKGLAGDADRYGPDSDDNRQVTFNELTEYVRGRVNDWVAGNRYVRQTPVAFPRERDRDIALTYRRNIDLGEFTGSSKLADVRERAALVEDLWANLSGRLSEAGMSDITEVRRLRPEALAKFESYAIRLEALVPETRSGEFDQLLQAAGRVLGDEVFNLGIFNSKRPANSLIEAERQGELDPQAVAQTSEFVQRWIEAHRIEERVEREAKIEELRQNDPYYSFDWNETSWFIWQWLQAVDGGPDKATMDEALDLLVRKEEDGKTSNRSVEWIEIKFIRLLHRYIDWQAGEESEVRRTIALAMDCRESAEDLLATIDDRSRYWIEVAFQGNDRTLTGYEHDRRLAEDLMFEGEFATAADAFTQLLGRHAELKSAAARMTTKLDLHQEALAKVPYLLAWEFRDLALHLDDVTGTTSPSARLRGAEERIETIRALTQLTHRLGKELYESFSASEIDLDDIDLVDTEPLRQQLEQAESRLLNRARELDGQAVAQETALVDIHNLLMYPLLSQDRRQNLRERYLDILAAKNEAAELTGRVAMAGESQVTSVDLGAFHDLVDSARPNPDENPFAVNEGDVRSELIAYLNSLNIRHWDQFERETFTRLETAFIGTDLTSDADRQRSRYFGLDHFVRMTVPILAEFRFAPGRYAETLQLNYRDAFELALARRALNDFWGNGVDNRRRIPDASPFYFTELANSHLNVVTSKTSRQRIAIDNLYVIRRDIARAFRRNGRYWMTVRDRVPFLPDQPSVDHSVNVVIPTGLPDGYPTINLHRPEDGQEIYEVRTELNGQRTTMRRRGLVFDADGLIDTSVAYSIPIQPNFGQQQMLGVTLAYRGHEAYRPFSMHVPVVGPGARFVEIAMPPTGNATSTVTVRGESRAISDVVIILDCSGSMNDPVLGGEDAGDTRFINAKNLLELLLGRLKEAGNYRVAVAAFGRRALADSRGRQVFNTEDPLLIAQWRDENVWPATDFEWIREFPGAAARPTTPDEFDAIWDEARTLTAYGLTPMFYSIREAAEYLRGPSSNPDAVKQIVVITDGINYQGNRSYQSNGVRVGDFVEIDGLGNLSGNNVVGLKPVLDGISLHMALYDVTWTRGERLSQQAFNDAKLQIQQLSELTGGRYIDSQSVGEIDRALADLVRVTRFSVAPVNRPVNGDPLPLNEPWLEVVDHPGNYRVDFTGADVPEKPIYLYGGESLELQLSNSGSLSLVPFGETLRDRTNPFRLGDAQLTVGRLERERHEDRISFAFAIQDQQPVSQHVDRPAFALLEVRRNAGEPGSEMDFDLYDYDYQSGQPVPVVFFPRIPIPQITSKTLTLRLVAPGRMPDSGGVFVKVSSEVPEDGTPAPFTVRGEEFKVSRVAEPGGTTSVITVVVEAAGDRLNRTLVLCPQRVTVNRRYFQNGQRAEYEFTVLNSSLDAGEVEVQIRPFDSVFADGGPHQALTFPYEQN